MTRATSTSCRSAQPQADGAVQILVAIADVDATVAAGTPLDAHASTNTTSVYTAAADLSRCCRSGSRPTSPRLAAGQERLAVVIDMTVDAGGAVSAEQIYRARVVNRAKLAYDSVAAWLDGKAAAPAAVSAVAGHGGSSCASRMRPRSG